MKSEKLAENLEKMAAKIEGLNHSFKQDDHQRDFNVLKEDIIGSLEDMAQLLREDAELEHEQEVEFE